MITRQIAWWGVKRFVLVFLGAWSFVNAAEHAVNRLSPGSRWVINVSVEAAKPEIHLSGTVRNELNMQSVRIVRRPIDLKHSDILYCKIDGIEWRYISQQPAVSMYSEPTYVGFNSLPDHASEEVQTMSGQWDYSAALPDERYLPTMCKITAYMRWTPSPGVEKKTVVESLPFELLAGGES